MKISRVTSNQNRAPKVLVAHDWGSPTPARVVAAGSGVTLSVSFVPDPQSLTGAHTYTVELFREDLDGIFKAVLDAATEQEVEL